MSTELPSIDCSFHQAPAVFSGSKYIYRYGPVVFNVNMALHVSWLLVCLFTGQKCMLTARRWSYCPTWWMVMPDLPWMDCRWLWRPREPTQHPQVKVAPLLRQRHTPAHTAGVWWPQKMLKKGCSDHTFSTIKQVGPFFKVLIMHSLKKIVSDKKSQKIRTIFIIY